MRTLIVVVAVVLFGTYGSHLYFSNQLGIAATLATTLCVVQDLAELKRNLKE